MITNPFGDARKRRRDASRSELRFSSRALFRREAPLDRQTSTRTARRRANDDGDDGVDARARRASARATARSATRATRDARGVVARAPPDEGRARRMSTARFYDDVRDATTRAMRYSVDGDVADVGVGIDVRGAESEQGERAGESVSGVHDERGGRGVREGARGAEDVAEDAVARESGAVASSGDADARERGRDGGGVGFGGGEGGEGRARGGGANARLT